MLMFRRRWWRRFFELVEFALVEAVFAGEAAVFVEDDFVRIDDKDAVDAGGGQR